MEINIPNDLRTQQRVMKMIEEDGELKLVSQSSAPENIESFGWWLRASENSESTTEDEANLLRIIKFLEPGVDKMVETAKSEMNLSLIRTTEILEKLSDEKLIEITEVKKDNDEKQKVIKITQQGMEKLKSAR